MNLAGRRCLVLGGGGFIGTNLCLALTKAHADVQGYGPRPKHEKALAEVFWHDADFGDRASLQAAVAQKDVVYHLIGRSTPALSNASPIADVQQNLIPSLQLIELCREAKVDRLIFASSGGTVYGIVGADPIPETAANHPITAYGINKLAVEHYLGLASDLYGMRTIALRISNPYGPHQRAERAQGLIGKALRAGLTDGMIEIWGDGSVTRDFVHVNDVVRAMLLCADYIGKEQLFNLGSGTGRTVRDVVDTIADVIGLSQDRIRYLPGRKEDVPVNVLDISRIERELAWRPTVEWRSGITSTADWMRSIL